MLFYLPPDGLSSLGLTVLGVAAGGGPSLFGPSVGVGDCGATGGVTVVGGGGVLPGVGAVLFDGVLSTGPSTPCVFFAFCGCTRIS